MVTRKPVPAGIAPYPTSPIQGKSTGLKSTLGSNPSTTSSDDQTEEQSVWYSEGQHPSSSNTQAVGSPDDLPQSLRAGPGPEYTPRSSSELQRPTDSTETDHPKSQTVGADSSASAWGAQAASKQARPPIPTTNVIPPTPEFGKLSLNGPSNNPWQPSLDSKPLPTHYEAPSLQREDSGNEAWAAIPPPNRAPPSPKHEPTPLIDLQSDDESPAWDEEEELPQITELPASIPAIEETREGELWGESQTHWHERRVAAAKSAQAVQTDELRNPDGWNSGSSGMEAQESGFIGHSGISVGTESEPPLPPRSVEEDQGPSLPPRPSVEEPPLQPPRPFTEANRSDSSLAKKQRKETYEIRKVRWRDATCTNNPRTSPILVQNVNGPCPLLALVNALSLSTPADLETPLVEALRSREQISLLLLLDAVIDELMRRGGDDEELPDVIDLHYFLLDLHTGMNVNPRFFPSAATDTKNDPRRSMSHVHPFEREDMLPGTFEETKETLLYKTFSIPLIHGWLPPKDSPAYAALQRSAPSYEEVQNLQFREEELEEKLSRDGLSFEEQGTLEDISTIKAFLNESATQLTPHGIDAIQKSILPGTFAILFRNNHFSTLYRHPETLLLFSLVTDMGYATHDEVVWESLADTNGENSELFSGDFRLVGGAVASPRQSSASTLGWTTSQGRRRHQSSTSSLPRLSSASVDAITSQPPQSPNTEQEDHDLALALQMQDEEDRLAAEETARRRREQELSQQYIEQQASSPSTVPVSSLSSRGRRTNSSTTRHSNGGFMASEALRPAIPPRRSGTQPQQPTDPEAGVDLPPPSYEQASQSPAYVPPSGSPLSPTASPNTSHPTTGVIGGIGGPRRSNSAYLTNQASFSNGQQGRPLVDRIPTGNGRRPAHGQSGSYGGQGLTAEQQRQREKDCVVM